MTLEVHFACWAEGKRMATEMLDGYPQERIRRPQEPYDSGWAGPKANEYYWDGDHIKDVKWAHPHTPLLLMQWNNAPIGTEFDDFFQQNRFVIDDCTGTPKYFYFPERHFKKIKTGPQTWKLIEV